MSLQTQINTRELSHDTQPNPFSWNKLDRIGLFAAHPDDIEMMMGYAAMLAVRLNNQSNVFAYVATNGEASTRGQLEAVRTNSRRQEAINGLGHLGISKSNIYLPQLPDGKLTENLEEVANSAEAFIDDTGITVALTLGEHGGDGGRNWQHNDHVAVHEAVMYAAGSATVWGLNNEHFGEVLVASNGQQQDEKLGAIALNSSQFPLQRSTGFDTPEGWQTVAGSFIAPSETAKIMSPYKPFLQAETYDTYSRTGL